MESRNVVKVGPESQKSSNGLRTPRISKTISRGLTNDVKVATSVPQHSDDSLKKYQFGYLHLEIKQPHTAILLLDSLEQNIVVDCLNALQKFMKKCDENKEHYVEVGGLPPVQRKMFETNTVIQRMSMKILALASVVHKAKLFIRDGELVNDLFTLAGVDDDVIVEYATCVVSNLATLQTGRTQITENEGIPVLVGLLSHNDPDIKRNALETLWQISADPLLIHLIVNEFCCAPVLKLVDSEYPPLQAIALLILEKVACRPEGVPLLEALNTFSVLADKLKNEAMVDLHRHCLKIFFHACYDRGTCKKFSGLVPAFVDIVERTPDAMARVTGIELVGRLCSVEQVAKSCTQCGVPELLHGFITSSSSDLILKEVCSFAIAKIARGAFSARRDFAKSIPALLEMINNRNTSERGLKCSLIAISFIIEGTATTIMEFVKAGGFLVFRKLLEKRENYSDDVVLSALATIDTIASSPWFRAEVVKAEMLPILLGFLKDCKQHQIVASVCSTLHNVLSETSTHAEFRKHNGMDLVLSIVNRDEFQIVVAAIPVINAICADPILMKEMFGKGLLQAMWARKDLIRNGPVRACFDRLISSNLSVKYAIMGHISPFEKFDGEFCDIGRLKIVDELKLPQDFKWEARQPRLQVILLQLSGSLDKVLLKNNSSIKDGINHIGDMIELLKSTRNTDSEITLIERIAKVTSDRFGGRLDKWRLTAKSEELEVEILQNQYSSVVIPVNLISTGAFRLRAMVFKAICDVFGIPCSLETSDYKKAWNVVLLRLDEDYPELCQCNNNDTEDGAENFMYTENLKRFVVDLVFRPGLLYPLGSFEAETYISAY